MSNIFINNKYHKIYNQIIDQARSRPIPDGYTEKHHALPASFGGKRRKANLVHLTAREHFICHRLLTKFTEGKNKAKMAYAMNMMLVKNEHHNSRYVPNSRVVAEARTAMGKAASERMTKNNHFKGKKHSDETKKLIYAKGRNSLVTREVAKDIRDKFENDKMTRKKIESIYPLIGYTIICDIVSYRTYKTFID